MRHIGIRNLAPLCGAVLGLLVLCNTASPDILQASDDAGGWWLVALGSPCGGDATLPCGQGQTDGVTGCVPANQFFYGVAPGTSGTVVLYGDGYTGCQSTSNPASRNCANVLVATRCR